MVSVTQIEPGHWERFDDGWVHEKTAPCLIIAQATQGRYEVFCRERHGIAETGEVFLAATSDPLRIVHHGDPARGSTMSARWLHVTYVLFGAIDLSQVLDLPLIVRGAMATAFGEIIGELLEGGRDAGLNPLVTQVRRQELALQALRYVLAVATLRPDRRQLLNPADRLLPVFAHVRNNLARAITVADLAAVAHLSTSRFHPFFRGHTGRTPSVYVKQARLDEARRLLLATDLPVWEIAERVGFKTQFHFSREFKRREAVPPLTYRRQYRELLV